MPSRLCLRNELTELTLISLLLGTKEIYDPDNNSAGAHKRQLISAYEAFNQSI